MDNDYKLSTLLTDKVLGNFQTWLPTLLESSLTAIIRGKVEFNPKIIKKMEIWYSYKLE